MTRAYYSGSTYFASDYVMDISRDDGYLIVTYEYYNNPSWGTRMYEYDLQTGSQTWFNNNYDSDSGSGFNPDAIKILPMEPKFM